MRVRRRMKTSRAARNRDPTPPGSDPTWLRSRQAPTALTSHHPHPRRRMAHIHRGRIAIGRTVLGGYGGAGGGDNRFGE